MSIIGASKRVGEQPSDATQRSDEDPLVQVRLRVSEAEDAEIVLFVDQFTGWMSCQAFGQMPLVRSGAAVKVLQAHVTGVLRRDLSIEWSRREANRLRGSLDRWWVGIGFRWRIVRDGGSGEAPNVAARGCTDGRTCERLRRGCSRRTWRWDHRCLDVFG